jgi:hypothetical protein
MSVYQIFLKLKFLRVLSCCKKKTRRASIRRSWHRTTTEGVPTTAADRATWQRHNHGGYPLCLARSAPPLGDGRIRAGAGQRRPIGSTALVLLRQRPTGLRWLDERWAAATDPLSPDYRHFSSAEIVRSVAPAPAERKVAERWVVEQGWIVSRRYGDALQWTRS